ncbi:unnamed protein product [Cuscuta epithymum]|uniref:Uncharacterized protein n=1 Tax=Cuscuta epithymum TaxID=186058 RepID=A0AAV0CV34_9ASTE|nr:unnamed protein product [Cuscuta epithymum]
MNGTACYDIILMAETVYSMSALPGLYKLIEKCTSCPHGVVYVATKKHYVGVGGGSRRFVSMVEKYGKPSAIASLMSESCYLIINLQLHSFSLGIPINYMLNLLPFLD